MWKASCTQENEVVTFPQLLRTVAHEAYPMRVRFTTSHPKDMSDETLYVIAEEPNVCKQIHLPVQSGSDKILKLMNRKYTREWYLDRVSAIRRIIPDCGLSTDIFVGYHDETEEDHQLSLSLMREVGYDSAFMFKYSESFSCKPRCRRLPISATRARSLRCLWKATQSVRASSFVAELNKERWWCSTRGRIILVNWFKCASLEAHRQRFLANL